MAFPQPCDGISDILSRRCIMSKIQILILGVKNEHEHVMITCNDKYVAVGVIKSSLVI